MSDQDKDPQPTHYETLSLTTQTLASQDEATQTKTVKQAYRRALLTHHPDKKAQQQQTVGEAAATSSGAANAPDATTEDAAQGQHFTVDQITEAYNVLSDATQRKKYTTRLLRQQEQTTSSSSTKFSTSFTSSGAGSARNRRKKKSRSKAGEETVDLDDMSWSGRRRLYYRACGGCGKPRGFGLLEEEIEEEDEEGEYEMVLECSGCGKELRVVVPPLGEGEGTGDEEEGGMRARRGANLAGEMWDQWGGSFDIGNSRASEPPAPPPEKKKGGWGFKLGIGLSLGGGVSAGRSR